MNGKISLSSKLNKGTSFRLFFSDVKFSENLECDENKNNKILSSIIIAEKNEENKKNIQNYFNLNYPNIKIYETSDAYETIKYSYNSNHRISLIILGKKIQSMKINDILEYLRSNNHTNDIPIVVIKDSKNKIKEFKLTEFIDTPLNEKKLTKILKKLNTNL